MGLFATYGSVRIRDLALGGVVFAAFAWWTMSGQCGAATLGALQASSMLLLSLGGRVPQILLNWRRGNTGELSLFTCLLNFSGNIVRLFTTLALTGDMLILAGTSVQTALNGILVVQVGRSFPPPSAPALVRVNRASLSPLPSRRR